MYDGTITSTDPHLIESWVLDNGMNAYMVYDIFPDSPRTWGREGAMVMLGEYRFSYDTDSLDGTDTDDRHEAMANAIRHYGNNLDMVSRYLSIYADAAAVDTTNATHTRAGWTVYGMVTRAEVAAAGIEDAAAYIRSELETYRQYAEGEVYDVIVTDPESGDEERLGGIYDDWPYNYCKDVAKELAEEITARKAKA